MAMPIEYTETEKKIHAELEKLESTLAELGHSFNELSLRVSRGAVLPPSPEALQQGVNRVARHLLVISFLSEQAKEDKSK